jgi:hypothetical protein
MKRDLQSFIEDAVILTSIFGKWPTFHDAEVVELYFERGQIDQAANVFDLPVLTIKLLLFDETGLLSFEHQTIAALQFTSIEDFTMKHFNYQNAIYGLDLDSTDVDGVVRFNVSLDGAFGMSASFNCAGIRVLNALPSKRGERPNFWLTNDHLAKLL